MKNIIKSKPFITAGIFAAVCLGVLLICILIGKNGKFEFTPDEQIDLSEPVQEWAENARLDYTAQPEESKEQEDDKTENEQAVTTTTEAAPGADLSAESGAEDEIVLTVMPEKPAPPERPDTAYPGERTGEATIEDVEAHRALDPALTNPNVKPDGTPPAAAKPADNNASQNSGTNGGDSPPEKIYFPGFGWIEYGGPNVGEKSGSDGDWNKQIGSMG